MNEKLYNNEYPKKWWNPKLKDFLENDPNKSLLSFAWSCNWRMVVLFSAVQLGFWLLLAIL